jgi:hypothetical protein
MKTNAPPEKLASNPNSRTNPPPNLLKEPSGKVEGLKNE